MSDFLPLTDPEPPEFAGQDDPEPTPEMIQAGARVLNLAALSAARIFRERELARDVYLAMIRARNNEAE